MSEQQRSIMDRILRRRTSEPTPPAASVDGPDIAPTPDVPAWVAETIAAHSMGVEGFSAEANARRWEAAREQLASNERDYAQQQKASEAFHGGNPSASEIEAFNSQPTIPHPDLAWHTIEETRGDLVAAVGYVIAEVREPQREALSAGLLAVGAPAADVARVMESVRAGDGESIPIEIDEPDPVAREVQNTPSPQHPPEPANAQVGEKEYPAVTRALADGSRATVDAHARTLGLRPLSGRNEGHRWEAEVSRYGILAAAHDALVDGGEMTQQQFEEVVVAPSREISNPNTWQMMAGGGLPELPGRLRRAAAEDRAIDARIAAGIAEVREPQVFELGSTERDYLAARLDTIATLDPDGLFGEGVVSLAEQVRQESALTLTDDNAFLLDQTFAWRGSRPYNPEDVAERLRGELSADHPEVIAVTERAAASFGPKKYTYRELTRHDPQDALFLGVEGSDAEANALRAQIAVDIIEEHDRILDNAYEAARGSMHEPFVPNVFGVHLIAEHGGDIRAVLADERLTDQLHKIIGSGYSVQRMDDDDDYEEVYIDPNPPEQQERIAELRTAITTAVTGSETATTAVSTPATDMSIPGGPTQPWAQSPQRPGHESCGPALRLS